VRHARPADLSHGHRLEPRPACGRQSGRRPEPIDAVVELAVVPHGHHRQLGVEVAQERLASPPAIQVAVVAERLARPIIRVHEVAEMQEEVEVRLLRGGAMRNEPAVVELLATPEGEPQPIGLGVERRCGAQAAGAARDAQRLEPVPVPAIGREVGHPHLHGVATLCGRHLGAAGDDPVEEHDRARRCPVDHRVHHQLGGQAQQVDVGLVLGATLGSMKASARPDR
jgi:hypothetical protein